MGKQKKTITSIITVHGLFEKFYNIHRFFNRYQWDSDQLGLRTLAVIIRILRLKELTIALDDTLVMKYGKCIFGRALHNNHARKPNAPKYIYGHNWVVIGAIKYLGVFKKWFCFPFLAGLFIPKEYCTNSIPFKSRIAMSVGMLAKIKERISVPVTLVADGLYAKKDLVRYCLANRISFLCRLRSDVALHRQPQQPKKRSRGRPRKYGTKISMEKLSRSKHKFETLNLELYGKDRCVQVRTLKAYWKPAGDLIKVFIVKYPKKNKEIINYYFTTDLTMPTEKAVSLIAARWSIETTFKDLKEHFGFADWQVRKETPVTRSATISCITYSLLILWTYQESCEKQLELWDAVPWYSQKSTVSSSNMIQFFKNKCISINIISLLATLPINQRKKQDILKLCSLAA